MEINIELLKERLDGTFLPARVLLRRAKYNVGYETTAEYNDPKYYPFFYYLGMQISPARVLQIGTRGGLIAHAFLQTSKSVDQWNYITDSYNSFSQLNAEVFIKEFGLVRKLPEVGPHDEFDLVIITDPTEKLLDTLNSVWDHLRPKGLLVIDYITTDDDTKRCFSEFCRVKSREPVIVETRYGTGILER